MKVYALPGHTLGSMVMLLEEERILISGDACNNSTFLFDENSLSVPEYRENLHIAKKCNKRFERKDGKEGNIIYRRNNSD